MFTDNKKPSKIVADLKGKIFKIKGFHQHKGYDKTRPNKMAGDIGKKVQKMFAILILQPTTTTISYNFHVSLETPNWITRGGDEVNL